MNVVALQAEALPLGVPDGVPLLCPTKNWATSQCQCMPPSEHISCYSSIRKLHKRKERDSRQHTSCMSVHVRVRVVTGDWDKFKLVAKS